MISFLRKVRKRLLTENRMSKYLLYAIGEIALVMIGILLALQVNGWNQERLERKEEKQIFSNLNEEFRQNKQLLQEYSKGVQTILQSGLAIMELIGQDQQIIQDQNLDSLFFNFLPALDLTTSSNSLKNVIQSGKMNLIQKSELITALNQWENVIIQVNIRENINDSWTNERMLPLLAEYISFKEMDMPTGYRWTGKSNLPNNKYDLFQSLVFENYLDNSLYLAQNLFEQLLKAEAIADEIIVLTQANN